jgi:hypothetical protein
MAALQIRWVAMPRVAPEGSKVLTGVDESAPEPEAAAPERAERPFLVYVSDPTITSDDFDKVESVILKDERVALGSRAFTCVRMSPDNASEDPIISKAGKETPRFVLVSADFKTATPIEKNKLSGAALWDGMKATAAKQYKKTLESAVKDMRDVLMDLDKLYGERKTLSDKLARLEEKGEKASPAEKKEIAAKLAAIDERQAEVNERQKTLWELETKA